MKRHNFAFYTYMRLFLLKIIYPAINFFASTSFKYLIFSQCI
ncbi:hypothetical protein CoNPh26_CDS0107 [Staphylococcus phage S-CoN_Ph26]|nr:hypothetical protein CoNPh26_CDS0107 [Staphylococcus phage S-CoN_Ph26]